MSVEADQRLESLWNMREMSGEPASVGLPDAVVDQYLEHDPSLARAIDEARAVVAGLTGEEAELVALDEWSLRDRLQESYMNFYPSDVVCPYVAVAARGPWIVTSHGAVIHDSGGYGMLGLGHAPDALLERLGRPWPMANVMTPTLSQKRFADRLEAEIGAGRGAPAFDRYACLNSGSEAVALTMRIVDLHAHHLTEPGARHHGKSFQILALENGFHGRTEAGAWLSHSTREAYKQNLASFRRHGKVEFVPPNDVAALEWAFADADERHTFIEAMYMEPVMGEGAPGRAITREFYDAARRLTAERQSLLVVDSIQAALRAHGCLSMVDYPGFEDCGPPDMETFSKALNAGQFPLSVVALRACAAEDYVKGVYGNTMTTNPRALELGATVLDMMDDEIRENIRARGAELKQKLEKLRRETGGVIQSVEGTGLLVCAEINPERCSVTGEHGLEEHLRERGTQVIHGGQNGVRFTPYFNIDSDEIDLILGSFAEGLAELASAE